MRVPLRPDSQCAGAILEIVLRKVRTPTLRNKVRIPTLRKTILEYFAQNIYTVLIRCVVL